jgi:uncharacterized membrane protein YhfC
MKGLRYLLIVILLLSAVGVVIYLAAAPEAIPPFLNSILMIVMPLALGIVLALRLKAEWRLFGIGMLTFVASQVVHIPFNLWVLDPLIKSLGLEALPGSRDLILGALLLGLSAGIFEETARYIVYSRWLEKARTWREGMMFGAGHGGVEAMILGALAFYVFLQAFVLRGTGLEAFGIEDVEATRAWLESYWNLPWYEYFLGAAERFSAICFHLSAALLVMQAFTRKNVLWYLLAVVWHALLDAVAVYGIQTWGAYPTEAVIFVFGLISLGIIFALRSREDEVTPLTGEAENGPPPLKPIDDTPEELTRERLENSRYD